MLKSKIIRLVILILILSTNTLHTQILESDALTTADRFISLTFSGDILPHKALYEKAKSKDTYNFDSAFSKIKKHLDGDINFCHLETTLTDRKPSTYPIFATPYQLASSLAIAGYNACDAVSNHSLDKGKLGVINTHKYLNKVGIKVVGLNTQGEDFLAYLEVVNGIKVGYLAYTYGTNGIKDPGGSKPLVNLIKTNKIIGDAKQLKSLGADIVVVYLHWGLEYQEKISASQIKVANILTSHQEINLIVGSHIHQLQSASLLNGKPVIFGMGNFWSGQGSWSNQPKGQIGEIIKIFFKVSENGVVNFLGGEVTPTFVKSEDWSINPANNGITGKYKVISCLALKEVSRLQGALLRSPKPCS